MIDICPIQMSRPSQLELPTRTWGGRRRGAGRKPAPGRRAVPHRRRVVHDRRCPVHVTLRSARGLPSFRDERLFRAVRAALAQASRHRFRVLHFSVQADHLHWLVEADEPTGFERGVRGLAIRVAKAVNCALGRVGRVWGDRYHARMLRTPREVRNALVYVLSNWLKHVRGAGARRAIVRRMVRWVVDGASAARRSLAGCGATHVACRRGMAAAWAHPCGRGSARRDGVTFAGMRHPE
jgi:putative transposase